MNVEDALTLWDDAKRQVSSGKLVCLVNQIYAYKNFEEALWIL